MKYSFDLLPSLLKSTKPQLKINAFLSLLACLIFPVVANAQILNSEFDSLDGWYPFGTADISISNDSFQGGNACLVRNRTIHWKGAAQSLVGDLEPGKDYHVTSYIKLVGSTDKLVQIQVRQTDDRGERFYKIGEIMANDREWTLLETGFNFVSNGTTTQLDFIFNSPSTVEGEFEFDYLLDSVNVVENDWRPAADARIEQIRKRNAELTFVYRDGSPAVDLDVNVQQINHHYGFGSTLNHEIAYNPIYEDFFARHFNTATVEFFTQWRGTEAVRGVEDYRIADISVDFAQDNGIKLKGHALVYPLRPQVPEWLRSLPPSEIQTELEDRVTSIATRYDGRLTGWDVSNEMLEEDWVAENLGESYRTWIFQRAREISPDAILSTNEFGMENSTFKTQRYRKLIESLLAGGAEVQEIGLQSHFFDGYVSPKAVEIAIEELAGLGIEMCFSEFDYVNPDPVLRAQGLENFYRYAFSRPEADGITMWGFWAGTHWRGPDASLVDLDWTINAAGQKYFELIDEWTTSESQIVGSGDAMEFRGFHGDYLVTTVDPETSITNYHLMSLPAGTNPLSLELRSNITDGSLTIYGTDGDDLFEYDLQDPDKVVVNGEVIFVDIPVAAAQIIFVGGEGNDRLETKSKQKNQHFIFSDQRLTVVDDQAIQFIEIEEVDAVARTLGSTVTLLDSAGDDTFSTFDHQSIMTTPDYEVTANNFRFVFGRSFNGGSDSAWVFDTPHLSDRLHSDLNRLVIQSGARFRYAIGFDETRVFVLNGNDFARVDLPGSTNSIAVSPTDVAIQSGGKSLSLAAFGRITINGAANNNDSVEFSGGDPDQTLRIFKDLLFFHGSGFQTTINNINQSTYNSSGDGSARIVVTDSPGDDNLVISDTALTYSSSVGTHTATGFDLIRAFSRNGGNDTSTISGSPPAILVGDWE